MCHCTGFADYDGASDTFNALSRGDRLVGVVRDTTRGRRGEGLRRV